MNALHRKALEEWSANRLSSPKPKKWGEMVVDSSTKSDLFCKTQFDGFLDSTKWKNA
jgi:hypothetical protein